MRTFDARSSADGGGRGFTLGGGAAGHDDMVFCICRGKDLGGGVADAGVGSWMTCQVEERRVG